MENLSEKYGAYVARVNDFEDNTEVEQPIDDNAEVEQPIDDNAEVEQPIDDNAVNDELEQKQAQLAEKEKELFAKEVSMTLKEHGLQAFEGVVDVRDSQHLADVVKTLTGIVNDIKVGAGYVPKENAKQDEYDTYANKKDVKGMIGNKLANLFK